MTSFSWQLAINECGQECQNIHLLIIIILQKHRSSISASCVRFVRCLSEGMKGMFICAESSFVQCRLDYGNSLNTGMSSANFDKLLRIQNTRARSCVIKKRDYVSLILKRLHWLPIRQRVSISARIQNTVVC